jgi:hypothetical protein
MERLLNVHHPLCISPQPRRSPRVRSCECERIHEGVIPFPICDPANAQIDDVFVRSASRPVLHPPSLPIVHFTPTEVGSNCYDISVLLSEIIQNCSRICVPNQNQMSR